MVSLRSKHFPCVWVSEDLLLLLLQLTATGTHSCMVCSSCQTILPVCSQDRGETALLCIAHHKTAARTFGIASHKSLPPWTEFPSLLFLIFLTVWFLTIGPSFFQLGPAYFPKLVSTPPLRFSRFPSNDSDSCCQTHADPPSLLELALHVLCCLWTPESEPFYL